MTADELRKRPNASYWKKRFELLEEASARKGIAYLETLETEYKKASRRVENEIAGWYQRFAKNNGVTLQEAKTLLNGRQLAELRWNVEEYVKHGQENALNQKWLKQLENASSRVHISRLDALQLHLQQQMEILYGNQADGMEKLAQSVYTDGYYRTAYEVQRGFQTGWDVPQISTKQLEAVLSRPWTTDHRTFRDRCWTQKASLVSTVQTELTQALMRGDSPDRAIQTIANQFGVSKSKAGRLVMTETAYFSSLAQKDSFLELGVERYEIVATMDSKTSVICRELDGKAFDMADYEAGVTAPPFHPWCRSCTSPAFEDEFTSGERAARGRDGRTYYVPSSMKYPEWEALYVKNGVNKEKHSEKRRSDSGGFSIQKAKEEYAQFLEKVPAKYRRWLEWYAADTEYLEAPQIDGAFGYLPSQDKILYNPNSRDFEYFDFPTANTHELAHRMDFKEIDSRGNQSFVDALTEAEKYVTNNLESIQKVIKTNKMGPFLSDILDALSHSQLKLRTSHGPDYWQLEARRVLECFADLFGAASIEPEDYEILREWFPEVVRIFETMV